MYVVCLLLSSLATCEDYKLLENMNKLTSLKYMEMKDISINISRNLQDLNQKCESSPSKWVFPVIYPLFFSFFLL